MKSALFPFILGLGGFIVFVSIELLYQLSEVIVSYKVPIWRLFELIYYNVPMFTVMGIPVGVLLAIFWVLSQMGSNSELMALQVHGISFKKIVIPFLILGGIFSVFSYLLSDYVVPDYNHRASTTITTYVYKQPESTIKANQFLDVGENRYFYVKRFDTEAGIFEEVLLYDLSQADMRIFYAKKAIKDETTGSWKLVDGRVFSMDKNGLMKLDTVFQETQIDLTKNLDEFIKDTSKRAQDLTSNELFTKIIAYQKMGIRTNSLEVEFHSRFANSLGPIIIAFLGVPLSLTFNIKSKSWSVIFTFLLIVLYQGSSAWMSALGKDGDVFSPFLASWLPDIFFTVVGLILFVLLDTKVMYRFKELLSRFFSISTSVWILVLFLSFFLIPSYGFSQTTSPATVATNSTTTALVPGENELLVKISADDMLYNGQEKTILLTGNVRIEYEKMILEAPKVTAYMESENWVDYFFAESSDSTPVKLTQEKETYTAKVIKAYVRRNAFFMYYLRGTFNAKNKQGQQKPIYLVTDQGRSKTFQNIDVTEIQTGYLTTCDLENPHYRFEAGYIVVKENQQIIAYDLLLYIFNFPLLPYPVYFADLSKDVQPVEASFSLSGEGGIQTHLKINYLNLETEKGSIAFDTVEKGPKKGATLGIENQFTLPFDVKGYLKINQNSSNDFQDQKRDISFEISKTFTSELKLRIFYTSSRILMGGIQQSRTGDYGVDFSGPFFLKGSTFTLRTQKKETRSLSTSSNVFVLPDFRLNKLTWIFFEKDYPIDLTFSGISFTGNTTTPGATPINEAIDSLKLNSSQSMSVVFKEIVIEGNSLVKSFRSDWALNVDFNKEDFTSYFKVDNTVPFQNITFKFGQVDQAYFSFDSAYIVRLGYLRQKSNTSAWRYSEDLKTSVAVNLWWLKQSISHEYLFLIAEGNTSGLGYDAEKNQMKLTTTLAVPFLFSEFTMATGFDFLKLSEQMQDPVFDSKTSLKMGILSLNVSTSTPYSLKEEKFPSTKFNFDFFHPWGSSNVNFIYVYENEIPVQTITNQNTIRFGKVAFISSFSETLNAVWKADSQGFFELEKLTQKNILKTTGIGTLKSISNTFEFEVYPLREEKIQWSYINESVTMEFDVFTTSLGLKIKPNNNMSIALGGSFPGFSFDLSSSYDFKKSIFQNIDVTIKKDLHCWENETTIKFSYLNEKLTLESFSTTFRIKAFPEKFFSADPVKETFDLSIF